MLLLATVAMLALVLGASLALADGKKLREQTFTIRSTAPSITYLDHAAPGKGAGDRYIFNSRLLRDGKRIGRLHGIKDTIRLQGGNEIVQNLMTFQFGNRNSIIASGVTRLAEGGDVGLVVGEPFERAITGGTGRFSNATGVLTTTRLPSGNYRQRFELVFPK
jgi:hypothetical protein